jgi:hypothetical protein
VTTYRVQFDIGVERLPDVMVRGVVPRVGDQVAIDDQGFRVCEVFHVFQRVEKENAVTREIIVRVK